MVNIVDPGSGGQVCLADQSQDLTAEFRYPPEEVNCWQSGCHGRRPYEFGFTLPTKVSSVIGQSALAKSSDAAQFNSYVRAPMPFWKPGSLTEEEAWRVMAFILRENGLWNGVGELNESKASDVRISRAALTPAVTHQQAEVPNGSGGNAWIILIGAVLLFSVLVIVLKKS